MSGSEGQVGHLTWVKGGWASFVVVQDDMVTLRSSIPSPPGSRIDGRLNVEPPNEPSDVRVKIHGSKLEADGTFTLRGRLIDANRELRDRLAALAVTSRT